MARYVTVWNFRGEIVTRFEDHVLWHPDSNTNNIYITSTQEYIFSYCRRWADQSVRARNLLLFTYLLAAFTDFLTVPPLLLPQT